MEYIKYTISETMSLEITVGRCRLVVSKFELKPRLVLALTTRM